MRPKLLPLLLLLCALLSFACVVVVFDPLPETPQTPPTATMTVFLSTMPATTLSTTSKMVVERVCNVHARIGLNVREDAGVKHAIIGYLEEGQVVETSDVKVVADGGTWKKVVERSSGMVGWVNARFLCRP